MSSYTGRGAVVEPNRVETWDVPLVDPPPGRSARQRRPRWRVRAAMSTSTFW